MGVNCVASSVERAQRASLSVDHERVAGVQVQLRGRVRQQLAVMATQQERDGRAGQFPEASAGQR